MNIDVFLHKVHADIVQMKRAVTTINANMGKINQILTIISNCKLFDLMVATSEVWVSAQNLLVVYNTYVCMFVCMCVCVYVCVYVCVCIYVSMYRGMYASMYICMYISGLVETVHLLRFWPDQFFSR